MHGWKGLLVAAAFAMGSGAPAAQTPTLKVVMRDKLQNAQRLLGAIITADYAAIERSADALGRISETEIGSWQARANPDYTRNAVTFLESVRGLREAVAQRDIEAANQEYTNLIASCIRCHKFVRDARRVSFSPKPGGAFIKHRDGPFVSSPDAQLRTVRIP